MKYVNNFGLPEGLANFVVSDEYNIGEADYSFSNLISPPQLRRLTKLHFNDIEIDVADQLWLMLGTAFHKLIAEAENHIILPDSDKEKEVEKRFYMNVGGYIISGQMDKFAIYNSIIEDYKITNMYKVLKGDLSDWHAQLNVYNLLLIANGYKPKAAKINAILKDWSLKDKANYGEDFPLKPFKVIDIHLDNPLDTLAYVIERIKAHEAVKNIDDPKKLSELSPCSEKERWGRPDKWVVKKLGGKRAVPNGTFDNEADAKILKADKGDGYIVEYVPGRSIRCESYCPVSQWCYQNKQRQPKLIMPDTKPDLHTTIIDPTPPKVKVSEDSEPSQLLNLFKDEDKESPILPDPVGIEEGDVNIDNDDPILPDLTPTQEVEKEHPQTTDIYKKMMSESGVTKDTPFEERLEKDKEVQWKILDAKKKEKEKESEPESKDKGEDEKDDTDYTDLLNSLLG